MLRPVRSVTKQVPNLKNSIGDNARNKGGPCIRDIAIDVCNISTGNIFLDGKYVQRSNTNRFFKALVFAFYSCTSPSTFYNKVNLGAIGCAIKINSLIGTALP